MFTLCVHMLCSADVLSIVFTGTKCITYTLITHIFSLREAYKITRVVYKPVKN